MKATIGTDYSPTPLHYLMYVLQQLSDELLLKEVGVSLSHVRIMGALDRSVPCSQSAIASRTRQTQANVSRQLVVMAKQNLVNITKNKKDSRQRDVTLSAKGNRKFLQAQKLLQKQQNSIYKNFSKSEKRNLEDSITKIINAL